MKKKLVYISHPSGGKQENTLDIEKCVRELYRNDDLYNNYCFVSPVHCYGFMYNDNPHLDYDFKGLSYCTDLLAFCDIMIVIGDWKKSVGCTEEVRLCKELKIPCIYFKNSDDLVNAIDKNLANRLLHLVDPDSNI